MEPVCHAAQGGRAQLELECFDGCEVSQRKAQVCKCVHGARDGKIVFFEKDVEALRASSQGPCSTLCGHGDAIQDGTCHSCNGSAHIIPPRFYESTRFSPDNHRKTA